MTIKVLQIIKIFLQKRLTFYYFIQADNSFNLCWDSFSELHIKSPHITAISSDPPWRAGSLLFFPPRPSHQARSFYELQHSYHEFWTAHFEEEKVCLPISFLTDDLLWAPLIIKKRRVPDWLPREEGPCTPHAHSWSGAFMSSTWGTFCLWVPSSPWKEEGPRPRPRPCWRRLRRTRRDTCPWERHLAQGRALKILTLWRLEIMFNQRSLEHDTSDCIL